MVSRQNKKNTILTLFIQCGAISFLLLLSIIIVACSGNGSSQLDPGTPVVTVTINLGQIIGSPTPPLNDYYCGGWATDTSPPFSTTSVVNVFGKFTHIVKVNNTENPEGVAGASATAKILWPDGSTETMTTTTTSDGLAVFPVAIKPSALNKLVTITITFTIPGVKPCTIPSAAYFTAILVSPTPTNTAVPSPTGTPTGSPTPGGTITPTGTPRFTPTPSPTKHP
jgi:hypothetical protein